MHFTVASCFQLDQRGDIGPRLELAGRYRLISGFHRAESCIEVENEYQIRYPGGDYITYHYYDEKILFVVCDGVSGGFGGYIASRFLGNQLIAWLKHQDFTAANAADLLDSLVQEMYAWVPSATRVVSTAPFLVPPTDETDRKFKEKRRARGAQTMFVAGVLDYRNDTADFFWMGDIRLLLDFGEGRRHIRNKVDGWSRHRWSTHDGPKGFPGGCRYKCSGLKRVVVYTDGLPDIAPESEIGNWKEEDFLKLRFVRPPDDVSVLVISIVPSEWRIQPVLDVPRLVSVEKSEVKFDQVPEGSWIRVKGRINNSTYAIDLEPHQTVFRPAEYDLTGRGLYEFQLVSGERLPSQYTNSIPLHGKPEVKPVSVPAEPLPEPIPPSPIPTPTPSPSPPQPQPIFNSQNIRYLLSLTGWVMAILGWGVSAYLFFRLYQAQDYAKEQQQRLDGLMATVTSLEALLSPPPTVQTPLSEEVTPTQPAIGPSLEVPTVVSPLSSPVPVVIPPTTFPTPVSTLVTEPGGNAGYLAPTPALDTIGGCRRFTTVAEGLVLYLEPVETSQSVLSVPISHTLTYLDAEGQWYLLRYGGEGPTPVVDGWARLQSLLARTSVGAGYPPDNRRTVVCYARKSTAEVLRRAQ